MEIRKDLDVCSGDFWYDLTAGYLLPEEVCKHKEDVEKVNAAITIVLEFQESCEKEIEGFFQ